ncbi:hypothetical protein, partial [Pseudomonas amygdali]
ATISRSAGPRVIRLLNGPFVFSGFEKSPFLPLFIPTGMCSACNCGFSSFIRAYSGVCITLSAGA